MASVAQIKGSSRFAGESILDLEEKVCRVPEPVGHPFDHLDAIVDALKNRRIHRIDGGSDDAADVFAKSLGELNNRSDLTLDR